VRYLPALLAPPLFLVVYLWDGIRRLGGWAKRSASIGTNARRGHATPVTATTGDSSSYRLRGTAWADVADLIPRPPANSYIGRTSSGSNEGGRRTGQTPRDSAD